MTSTRHWQYRTGTDSRRLPPDGYTLNIAYMAQPGAEEIKLELIGDYKSNVVL
ncbi:hypothetical protein [Cupriavidus sp. IDO]|uniref:hypothetical protein n=1 Tax=Cupriavidus sp. IDO TaxID=1539142 RepID=UPI000B339477|nr:hypothetical protein [Cupriavidus sp. IDO]